MLLLHLSDLHFGNKNRFANDKPADLGRGFHRALQAARKERKIPDTVNVSLVIVTGDIVESGLPSEFRTALEFLVSLAEEIGLPREQFVFLPGNHDISWADCRIVRAARDGEKFPATEFDSRLNHEKLANYRSFLSDFYGMPVNDESLAGLEHVRPLGRGGWLRNFPDLQLSVAALNTSEREHDELKGGYLSTEQAQALMTYWREEAAASQLKILALHHNPVSTTDANRDWILSWLREKERVAGASVPMSADVFEHYIADIAGFVGSEHLPKIVEDTGPHVVLHGHHHDLGKPISWHWKRDGNAPVLSVGSFGLSKDQLPGEAPLSCQFLRFVLPPEPTAPRLIAIPLVYDGRFRLEGDVLEGAFRAEVGSRAAYDQLLPLPNGLNVASDPVATVSVPLQPRTFLGKHEHLSYDRQPVNTRKLSDLDRELISKFLAQPLSQTLNADLPRGKGTNGPTVEQQLENLLCYYDGHPTLGALLCFAYGQSLADKAGCCTLQMAIHDSAERDGENTFLDLARGNLLFLFNRAMSWLTGGTVLRRQGRIGSKARDDFEIPELVLREAIANALVHRDYETTVLHNQPTRIDVYPDKVEVTSYGSLLKQVSVELLNSPDQRLRPWRRNEVIAGVFQCMTEVELNASGVPRMRRLMTEAGLALPLFRAGEDFVCVTLARPFELSSARVIVPPSPIGPLTTRKAFISSLSELSEHRKAAQDACLRAGVIPIMWKQLASSAMDIGSTLRHMIDEADLFILIVSNRYGAISDRDGVSFTEMEFNYANARGLPVLAFTMHPDHPISADTIDRDPEQQGRFEAFKRKVRRNRFCTEFKSPDDLRGRIIEALLSFISVASSEALRRTPAKPINLPYPTIGPLFKGRDECLEQLRSSLGQVGDGTEAAITGRAVHGLGGTGKTRLAVEYAWRHAEEYSAVLFVTADSPENLRRNLAELTGPVVLDLEEQAATEEEVRVAAALRWLAEHPGWFLILDNVDTEEAAECVEGLLPQLQRGHVLITSRLGRWSGHVQPLELDVLASEDATEFLLQRTEPHAGRGRRVTTDDASEAAALAEDLDGLALALEQAGAYIVARRQSLGEYRRLWRLHDSRVQSWHDARLMKYPRSIAVTWQTTLDQLGGDERRLLDLLAWFASEPIPLAVFSPCAFSAPLRFEKKEGNPEIAEASGEDWDDERFRNALAAVADFSMLRWDAESETVTVHRVVQEILRTRQDEPHANLTAALRLLDAARPKGSPADVRTWPTWELLRPHVAFAVREGKHLKISVPTSDLMGYLGTLLWSKALHQEAETLERDALAIDEQQFGPDSTEVAIRLNNLAQTLQATNRLSEAEPLMRRALAIDEQALGAEHPSVAIRLNNLAQFLQATNRLSEAEPLMRRALAIDEQSYGVEHPNVARDLNNLAQLLQATNRLSEAEPLMRRALAIDEQAYGAEHPNVAIAFNNLATLLNGTNRFSEAEPLMRRALAIDEQSYGAEHPNVAIDLNNLAQLLQATNRLSEAEPLMARVVTIFERSYGDAHPNVAIALNNLAQLLQATNRLSEAEPLMRRALAIDEQSYGAEHPNVAIALNNLAQLLQATNRLSEAEPLMRRALAIDEQSYGSEHPSVAVRLNNLTHLFQATGRLTEAELLMQRQLKILAAFSEQSGRAHPLITSSVRNYVHLLGALGLGEAEISTRIGALLVRESVAGTSVNEFEEITDGEEENHEK